MAAQEPSIPEPQPQEQSPEPAVKESSPETKKPEADLKEPVPETEKPEAAVKEPEPETEKPEVETRTETQQEEEKKVMQSASFNEESNVVTELPDVQKKALEELKKLVQEALNKHEFTAPASEKFTEKLAAVAEEKKKEEGQETVPAPPAVEEPKSEEPKIEDPKIEEKPVDQPEKPAAKQEIPAVEPEKPPPETAVTTSEVVAEDKPAAAEERTVEAIEESVVKVSAAAMSEETHAPPKQEEEVHAPVQPEEVSIWGVPLLADEGSDVILLKFLRARDYKVKDAFTMLKNTVKWRKEFGIDELIEQDLGNEWEKVVFMHGFDKDGHPVSYNVYGEFMNKELYHNTFGDEEKRNKFVKYVIQSLEKSVRKLDFSPTGVNTIVQVNDLRNSPGLLKRELRQTTDKALQLLQDNYPEFVAKQVFINVPWWYLAFYRMISPFLTQRSKSKFVFVGPSRSAETLFKYISPEQVPVQYGGLSNWEGEKEFTIADVVTEVTVKPTSKHIVELPVPEISQIFWELRVIGGDVSYSAEFVPNAEDSYTIIVQKSRKITTADEAVISSSYKAGEPGKIVLTIDNQSSKKKKLLYRSKTKLASY